MSDAPPSVSRMGGKAVLFVMAAEPEYGPHLKARFAPLMTGVGPVEAAVEMTAALSTSIRAGSPPDLVVSLGSAGSRVLEQAEIHPRRDLFWTAGGLANDIRRFLKTTFRKCPPITFIDTMPINLHQPSTRCHHIC